MLNAGIKVAGERKYQAVHARIPQTDCQVEITGPLEMGWKWDEIWTKCAFHLVVWVDKNCEEKVVGMDHNFKNR